MAAQMKFLVDLSSFENFAKKVPDVFDKAAKDAIGQTMAKLRKEFISTIDTKSFDALESTAKYQSKYKKPLQMMKSMIRFKVTGRKKINGVAGVFVGKVQGRSISNATFKSKYGVTATRFAQVMTYGGRLKIDGTAKDRTREAGIKRMVKEGFFARKGTKQIKFPRRDWYSPTRFRRTFKLLPYLESRLKTKVDKWINRDLSMSTNRKKGVFR